MRTARDGVINNNGLSAEFRFIRPHPSGSNVSCVETAGGEAWVLDKWLTYDPVRDLTPEAAALVEQAKETP